MNWRSDLFGEGNTRGREVIEDALGMGVVFPDGFDVFWIAPGEVFSTVAIEGEDGVDVRALFEEYERIGRVRERAIHVIGHHLVGLNAQVTPFRNGRWGIRLGATTTALSVGGFLTSAARETGSVGAVVEAAFANQRIAAPSAEEVRRYLERGEAGDFGAVRAPDAEEGTLIPQTIRSMLGMMGLCRALDHGESLDSMESLLDAAKPEGRIARTLLRVEERVPGVKASIDLARRGVLTLEFDDPYGGFDIDTRSKRLAARIHERGPTAAGDELAEEYLLMKARRREALGAIWRAAAKRGWKKQEFRLPLFGIGRTIYLGEKRREVTFNPEALMERLRTEEPRVALREFFAERADFGEACVAALEEGRGGEKVELGKGDLHPLHVPAAAPLAGLEAAVVREMDAFAAATIREHLADKKTVWEYRKREFYDPASDRWATLADWVALAEKHIDGEWPSAAAILILLDAGDRRGEELAERYLARAEPHDEVSGAEVELVWRMRHRHPEVARAWFLPRAHEDVPYAEMRAPLGDPVARRYVLTGSERANDPEGMGALQREEVRGELVEWARTSYRWSPPDSEKLRMAWRMGWREVGEALAENPYLLAGLLTAERRSDQFDNPGALMASEFFLI
jgi:hypothetical protein